MNHPRTDSASQALEKANALLHRAAAHSKSNSSSPTRTQLDPKSTTKTKPSKSKKFDWEDDSDGGSDDSSLFGPSDSDPDSDEAELKKYLSNLAKKKAADEKASGKQNNTSVTAKPVSASSSYLKKPPLATATTPPPANDVKPIKEQYLNSIPSTPVRQSSVSKLDSSQVLKPRVADNVGNISALNTKIERLNADMDAAKSALGNNLGDLESEVESIEKSPKRSGAVSSPLKGNLENRRMKEDLNDDDDDVSSISDLNTSEMETRSSLTGRGGAARNLPKRSYLKEKKGGFGSDSDESVAEVKKAAYRRSNSVGTKLVVDVGKKAVEIESGGETKSTPVLSTPAPTPVVVAASLQTQPKLQVPQQTTHTAATTTVSEITEDIDAPTDSSIAEEIEESGDESRSKFNDLLTIEDLDPQTKQKPTSSQSYSTPPPPPKHQSVPTQAAQTPQQYNEQPQHQPTQQQQYTQIPPSQPTYQYPFYPPPPNQSAPPQIPPQAPPPPHPYQFPPYGYGYAYPPPSPYTPMYPVYPPQHHTHYAPPPPPPSAWMGSSGGATTFVNPYLFRGESRGSSGGDRKGRSDRKGLRRCDHSCGCLPVMEAKETGERRREGKKERRRGGEREKGEGRSGEGRSQEEEDVSSYGWTSSSEDVRGGRRETKEGLRGNVSGKESDGGREFWKDTISPLMQNFEAGHASLMASFAPSTLAVNALLQNHLSMIQQYVVMNEKLLQEEVYHTQEYITLRSTKDEIKQRRRESARERDAFEQAVKEAADTLSYND